MGSIFEEMAAKWKSPICARTEIETFTGGAMKEKYCANLDAANLGCKGRFRMGRKVVYPVVELVKWLENRSSVIPERVRQTE
ncbi:MAG: hypothetical protein ACYDH8_09700 [Syntrophales bacterium]